MRVLIADRIAEFVPGSLAELGCETRVEPKLSDSDLAEAIQSSDSEVLIVRSTRVTETDLVASERLALVIRAGAGVSSIDLDTASGRGIYVANCPGKNAAAVAELTIAHLLNLDRRVTDNVIALRDGRWNKREFSQARGLRGRTLAVLGVGTIGREVIRIARNFGMRVVAWSRSLTPEAAEALDVRWARTPEEAAEGADAVTVHLALSDDTRGRIGASVFEAMRPDGYFINTSRGEVVVEADLARAVADRGLRAGLDVFHNEPATATGTFSNTLAASPGVYGTHHIGASTLEAVESVGHEVVRIVRAYVHGRPIPNCVNLADQTGASHTVVVRHEDRVGVLAHVLDVLSHAGHNVQEMTNTVFEGSTAACARLDVRRAPGPETLTKLRSHPAVFSADAVPTPDRST